MLTVVAAAAIWFAQAADADTVRPRIGLWYTVWWTEDDQFHHWSDCTRLPARGRYTAGDPKVIADHYAQFRDLGIDFLIMDDTNGIGNDGDRINDNIRAWYDFMDALPADERIPICVGGGGEMRAEGAPGQSRAAGYYWDKYAQLPSYFVVDGKPLLLIDTDDNYGPGDWDDPRFTVRWTYNGDNHEAMAERHTWGWGSYEPAPELPECMSIWPGHRFAGRVRQYGRDDSEQAREGGRLYIREWLRVLSASPEFATLADWNNWQEETAIEDGYSWDDAWGFATPDLYTRITRAYSRLRTGRLVKGECYRAEDKPEVYLFDGERLVHQSAEPRRAAVMLTPSGLLERIATEKGS